MAALVTPLHHKSVVRGSSSSTEDESYYLLSWRCKCGDKDRTMLYLSSYLMNSPRCDCLL
uniref:Uncharacterized protein n=1 Tax=Salix viminalis TaxID=40686 RepID=A0A6N2KJP1_SALVM